MYVTLYGNWNGNADYATPIKQDSYTIQHPNREVIMQTTSS